MLRSRGVTAIELLVILVMVIVLVAIFSPVYTSNGRGEPAFKCLSNLKRLGLGAIMYSNDSDDRFPVACRWMDFTTPYVGTGNPFHDPDDGVEPKSYGYAFRERASSVPMADFDESTNVILIFDSSLAEWNSHTELWSMPQEGRHKAKQGDARYDNVVFVDGHSRRFRVNGASQTIFEKALADDDKAMRQAFGKQEP